MVSIYRIPFRLRFTLPGDIFTNIDKIGDVCCPVFVIHGTRDEIVPVWHGQALHEMCVKKGIAYEAYVVEGGDHNNLEMQDSMLWAGDVFYERVARFLEHLKRAAISEKLQRQAERAGF
eukprot:g7353.t1